MNASNGSASASTSASTSASPTIWVRGGRLIDPGEGLDAVGDVWIRDGVIVAIGSRGPELNAARSTAAGSTAAGSAAASSAAAGSTAAGSTAGGSNDAISIDARGCLVTPMFTDLHVHLREPGGEESETIATGTAAALAGGFGTVYAMPNTSPTADRIEVIEYILKAAAAAGPCEVVPVSAITVGLRGRALVDLSAQALAGAGAFSDDGAWVASDELAADAFRKAAEHDWLVMEHCEDFGITGAGILHDAPVVKAAGIAVIAREAEDRATMRDLELARQFGTRLHLCHVSTAGAVAALRRAKDAGLNVSGEVTPHHLVLTVEDALHGGVDFKMKPPLRDRADVDALVRALEDGTLDAIGTDHAPHVDAKKAAGLPRAPFGAIGLETAFPVLYTELCGSGRLSLTRLVEALVTGPARVARRVPPAIRVGVPARLNVIDIERVRIVDRARFQSKSRNCPFHGMSLRGWPTANILGHIVIEHRPF